MRLSVRILSIVSIMLSAFGIFLLYGSGGLSDTDPLFGVALISVGFGFLVAFATFVTGIIAAALRRQFGWMIGIIAAGLLAIVFPIVAGIVVSMLGLSLSPVCQPGLPPGPQCQQTELQTLALQSPSLLAMAGPLLVGLVALAYTFAMRAPLAVKQQLRV